MRIHIQGNQFLIGDEVRPYFFRTSFCLLGLYQAGRRDLAQAWLDRCKELGFDGVRFFGENEDWFDTPTPPPPGPDFYGTTATPKIVALGPNAPGSSALKLVPGYGNLVAMLAEDLEARGMVGEFCCIATVKGRDPSVVSNALNAFPQLFDGMFPHPRESPFLYEAINEWNAHASLDPDEMFRIGSRFRRDGEKRNFPGSTIGISAGGSWSPGFNDTSYTHRNLHPPRDTDWDDLSKLEISRDPTRPLALNETVHYMTQAEWNYWIKELVDKGKKDEHGNPVLEPRIGKWANLSTSNHVLLLQYYRAVLAAGVSVTAHDLIGQMTDPTQPLSPLELAIKEWRKPGGVVVPPLPTPEGAMKQVDRHIDENNNLVAFYYERPPEVIHGGSEDKVLREGYHFDFGMDAEILEIKAFHGLDRGDIVEMDTEVHSKEGIPLYERSDHKEDAVGYPAWESSFPVRLTTSGIIVGVVCRVNGENKLLPDEAVKEGRENSRLTARAHFGLRVIVMRR